MENQSNDDKAKLAMLMYLWYKDPAIFFRDLYNQEPYPYQARFIRDLPKLNRMMLLSAAGIGKTKLLACAGLWLAIVYSHIKKKPYDVLILSGSLDQAKKLYEYSATPLQEHPILSKFVRGEILKQSVSFITGSNIKALPLSLKAIQGQHVNAVIVDEAALVDDFTINDTYRIIGGEEANPDNKLVLIGTPTNYVSKYVEMWEDEKRYPDYWKAEEKDRDPMMWARYSWSAIDCKRFSLREIEDMKKTLTDEQFNVFWLGKPYPLTNTVVPIQAIRKQSIGYERFRYNPSNKIGKIIFGIDYGMTDKSVLIIIQMIDDAVSHVGYQYRVLECLEWKGQEYDNVHDWIEHYADMYHPDYVFVDLNPKGESERTLMKLLPKGYNAQQVNLGAERSSLQTRMRFIFEHEAIIIPQDFIELLNNVKQYTWDKIKGDDYVTALFLSLKDTQAQYSTNGVYIKVGKIR